MRATRRALRPEKFENHEKVRGYQSNKKAYDFVQTMMEVMS